MKPTQRRQEMLKLLRHSREPLSGRYFAERFGISRQVVVGDIAALRQDGESISATPLGYLYQPKQAVSAVYKCFHTNSQTEDELRLIVSLGGSIIDVMVRHRIYGKLSAQLSISSDEDIDNFMEEIRLGKSVPLMNVTSGYHYHTIAAKDKETLTRIADALRERGYLLEEKYL